MFRTRRALLLAVTLVLVAAACAGDDEPDIDPPSDLGTDGASAAGATTTTGDPGTTLVAQASGDSIDVWSSPAEGDDAELTLHTSDEASAQIILVVKQQLGPEWLEVWLPTPPAGSTGWVQRDDVSLSEHRFRVQISLSAHTLVVYAGEVTALEAPVAIGATDAPPAAPGLYIKDLIEPPNPGGLYGRYAYGLSGSSNRLQNFESGSGVIGIHGTADESTLGQDVPQGSIAIGAEPLNRLVGSIGLPLGTPVEIRP